MPAIEYAVKMRQFPDDARLDRQLAADALQSGTLLDFAAELARFHASLPELAGVEPPERAAAAVRKTADDNLRDLAELLADTSLCARLEEIRAWTGGESAARAPAIARRLAGSTRKECHGDLHLENLLVLDGKIVAFDALEFDPRLREIDIMSETSFLAMDLHAHGRADLAFELIARYLETGGDYAGLDVLRFYWVYRAMVRAKVRAIKAQQAGAHEVDERELAPYFAAAQHMIEPHPPPLLAITHGLSGSGKTNLTNALIGRLPALRVRSDLERKRLHGLAATADSRSPVGGGLYAAVATTQTYARLREITECALGNGFDLIVDATFLRRAERDAFRALAAARDASFAILDCAPPTGVLRERIRARAASAQASEANQAVLDFQLAHHEPLTAEEQAVTVTVDTEKAPDYARLCAKLLAARGLKASTMPPK